MKRAIYAGSFDPVTLGHIDIITRAAKLVDELFVVVMINENKKSFFTLEERREMLENELKDILNVKVDMFSGLLVDYAKQKEANILIRGMRSVADFEYESAMAQTNKALSENVESVFLITDVRYAYISSSVVKEVASFNGDISKFVSKEVEEKVLNKIKKGL